MNTKITDFKPDPANSNKGTERGAAALQSSIQELGLGRSIVVDRNDVVIAGNKTWETAAAAGIDKVKVIETTGDTLVVVRRTDMDLQNDPRARRLAIADNRIGQINLDLDPEVLLDQREVVGDLGTLGLTDAELELMVDSMVEHGVDTDAGEGPRAAEKGSRVKVVLRPASLMMFETAIRETGIKDRGEAIAEVCRFYVQTTRQLDANSEGKDPAEGAGDLPQSDHP